MYMLSHSTENRKPIRPNAHCISLLVVFFFWKDGILNSLSFQIDIGYVYDEPGK